MVNQVLASFLISDVIFMGTGILLIVAASIWRNELAAPPTTESVGRMLLLQNCPLVAVIANGALVLFTFVISLPAFALPTSRVWLKIHSWLIVVCAIFTLVLGLNEWIQTLTTRANLETVWGQHDNTTQSLLQQKFDCCGYLNSTTPPFVQDSICTNDIVAAAKEGCVSAFTNFAETWVGNLFTAAFGVVGMDVVLLLAAAMLNRYRKEQLRYRAIDQKWGVGNI